MQDAEEGCGKSAVRDEIGPQGPLKRRQERGRRPFRVGGPGLSVAGRIIEPRSEGRLKRPTRNLRRKEKASGMVWGDRVGPRAAGNGARNESPWLPRTDKRWTPRSPAVPGCVCVTLPRMRPWSHHHWHPRRPVDSPHVDTAHGPGPVIDIHVPPPSHLSLDDQPPKWESHCFRCTRG